MAARGRPRKRLASAAAHACGRLTCAAHHSAYLSASLSGAPPTSERLRCRPRDTKRISRKACAHANIACTSRMYVVHIDRMKRAGDGRYMGRQARLRCLGHSRGHSRRIRVSRHRISAAKAAVHASTCGNLLTKDSLSKAYSKADGPAADRVVGRRPDNFCRASGCARYGCGRKRDARSQRGAPSNSRKARSLLSEIDARGREVLSGRQVCRFPHRAHPDLVI